MKLYIKFLVSLLLLLPISLSAQKNEYRYRFKPPFISSYYYCGQIKSSDKEAIKCAKNNEILLSVTLLEKNGSPMESPIAAFRLITYDNDTIIFWMDSSETTIKIPKQSFDFEVHGFPFDIYDKNVIIENKNINKISIIVGRGASNLNAYYIISKKELSTEELIMIGNDITNGTNTSNLIKGKDYYILVEM